MLLVGFKAVSQPLRGGSIGGSISDSFIVPERFIDSSTAVMWLLNCGPEVLPPWLRSKFAAALSWIHDGSMATPRLLYGDSTLALGGSTAFTRWLRSDSTTVP